MAVRTRIINNQKYEALLYKNSDKSKANDNAITGVKE